MKSKTAQVLRDAAIRMSKEPIRSDNGICWAIQPPGLPNIEYRLADAFVDSLFQADAGVAGPFRVYWGQNFAAPFPDFCDMSLDDFRRIRHGRIMALLFAAHVAEDEGI